MFGTGGVIILVVGAWIKIWSDRVNSRLQANLEHLRADLTERREQINQMGQFLSSGFTASQERRLAAIEKMWQAILTSERLWVEYLFVYDVLHPSRYSGPGFDKYKSHMSKRTMDDILADWTPISDSVSQVRPFLGETLWILFRVHTAVTGRIGSKVMQSLENSTLLAWDNNEDTGKPDSLFFILRQAFTDDELTTIIQQNEMSVPQRILDAIRIKILDEANRLIFGKLLIEINLAERLRLESKQISP